MVVDAGRPLGLLTPMLHRMGTALLSPLVGLLGGAVREYWYFHRSLDKLPQPRGDVRRGTAPAGQAVGGWGSAEESYGVCLVRCGD